MAAKIRCGDEIIVLSGKNKGKRGKIKNILPSGKAIVKDINIIKKHKKPIPDMNQLGGIIEKEAAIDISNLAIFNLNTNKADRVQFKIKENKKVRIFKSNGLLLDN